METTAILPKPGPVAPDAQDPKLVVRAQAGDREAQEELARHYRRTAFLFALKLLGNRDDAMDVAQDAMLRFFTSLKRFDHSRPVTPWLLRIVRNRVRDLVRRGKVRQAQPLESAREDRCLEIVDPVADPESDRARRELQRRVWQALRNLGVKHREILVLRDYQDLSYQEIAQVLGIPLGTVMSRLHTARKRLRQGLRREGGQDPSAATQGGESW